MLDKIFSGNKRTESNILIKNLSLSFSSLLVVMLISSYSLPSYSKTALKIDTFKDISECKYSSRGKGLGFSCYDIANSASKYAESLSWPFKTVNECYLHYGLDSCYANKDGYLSVKPSGFAFIHKGSGVSLPFYSAISLGSNNIVLPNGYEISKGRSLLSSDIGDVQIKNFGKAHSLGEVSCLVVGKEKICASLSKLLLLPIKYKKHVLAHISNN